MIYTFYAKKVELYINTNKKTAAQVKAETGCDVLINGGLYDMETNIPCLYLKKDNKYIQRVWSGSKPYGFGWESGTADLVFTQDHAKYDNFINCTELCKDGRAVKLEYDTRGGKRGRTAIGVTNDGLLSVVCSSDGTSEAMTPETLQSYALKNNWKDGMMLDSGGSSQCVTPVGNITSTRRVHNYICIWEDDNIKTYSRAKNGSKKLSANFAVREFAVTGNDTVRVDMRLVDTLQKIRTRFGKAVNIRRTSAQVPSAASIYISGINPIDIARYAESIGVGEIGLEKTTVHIGITDRKVRWDKTSGVKKTVETFMQDNAAVVKERFGFDDNTMKYLKDYRFADALLEKLATAK